ncbi:alpha/beta fold hydrolase [Roseomonas haemaphysalidis]|uniref:Alpha/beta hydrolase n=1 Tax=Roseomonas haemaphysalidis TaxID=2768162 RepID=A0ABS3KU37_9PROT|nr:alpha/beta hydrolase [Roseomonas haemaphysalidis]MBO1080966.1 alpha/beta hydrolase [Roseomonas haemaphysalidis]
MAFVKAADGTEIFYKDWGNGKPVVLIHGWPVNADMWEYQAPVLAAAGFRVISYDRRGFGRSGQPWSGYDYDTMSDDLATLMDELDLRDATLVGFSMGGGEVARYMSRHGAKGRVAKAVFVAAVPPFLLRTADNPEGVDRTTFDQMVDGLKADRPHFLAGFGKQFFGAGLLNFAVTNEILDWSLGMAMMASPKATLDCVRAFSETDFRADLPKVTVPTLVIHGTDDATVPPDVSARRAAAALPNARLVEYSGAPHGLFFTEKDKLNQDLIAFIRG